MVCGLLKALSVIVRLPVYFIFAAGEKVTLILQVFPGARVPPLTHVVPEAIAKFPLIPTVVSVSKVVPEFVSVTVLAALVVPDF